MKGTLLSILILCFVATVHGQQKKRIENVMGEVVLTEDLTIAQGREKAIQMAKIEALRKAGVSEHVSEFMVLQKSEKTNGDFSEIFNSLTSQEVNGEIAYFVVKKEEKSTNETGHFILKVWLDVDVIIQEQRPDPLFYFNANGIRENYHSPDKLTFQLKPSMPGFVNIFIIDEKENSLLYPNKLERSEQFSPDKQYTFPLSTSLDYEVSTVNNVEVNYILILFTKKEIHYSSGSTISELLTFVAKISPDEKFVKMYPIVIKKEL